MKKLFLLICLLLLPGLSFADDTVYVSVAGGTYPAGDNSDGSTWAKAFTSIDGAFDAGAGTDDDTIILDPTDIFNQTVELTNSGSSKTGGSVTVQSETLSPTSCLITGTSPGNYYLFRSNETDVDVIFTGVTFKDHLRNDGEALILISQGNFTLNDCIFDNLDQNTAGIAGSPILYVFKTGITFTADGLEIKNCDFTATQATNGSHIASNNVICPFVFSNFNVHDNTCTYTGAGIINGFIFSEDTFTLSGTNTFTDNSVTTESGVWTGYLKLKLGSTFTGSTTFDNCDFSSTLSSAVEGGIIRHHDLALNISGTFVVKNCDISSGGTLGGIVHSDGGSITMTGSELYDNTNSGSGIISNWPETEMTLSKCEVYDNTALNGGAVNIYLDNGTSSITNCLFHGNTATAAGGSVYGSFPATAAGDAVFNYYNNTESGNAGSAADQDGIYYVMDGTSGNALTVNIINIISWNANATHSITEASVAGGDSTLSVTYSDIRGGPGSVTGADTYTDNINSDPLFVDAANDNYALKRSSPAINTGTDLSGSGITDDIIDTSRPQLAIYDMGAYEFFGAAKKKRRLFLFY